MRATFAATVLFMGLALGGAWAWAEEAPLPAQEVLKRVVERYRGLQSLRVEGRLTVSKRALGFEEKVEATYTLVFRQPMDVLYQLVWKMAEAQSGEATQTEGAETRHTLQCFGGVVQDYYEAFRFEEGGIGEAVVLRKPPDNIKGLDLSPLLERVLLAGMAEDVVGDVLYAGPGGEDFDEIAFELAGPPLREEGPRPTARVTLWVERGAWLLKGYRIEAVAPEAVSTSVGGQYEVTDLVVVVEAKALKTQADEKVEDDAFAFKAPRRARAIDERQAD